MSTLHRLFVYGTLRRGESNHRLLEKAECLGHARTAHGFRLYDLGSFPGMVALGDGRVRGELFEVDDATLARVDRLESHPRFYERTVIRIEEDLSAYSYLLRLDQVGGCPAIRSGDWLQR